MKRCCPVDVGSPVDTFAGLPKPWKFKKKKMVMFFWFRNHQPEVHCNLFLSLNGRGVEEAHVGHMVGEGG